MGRKTRPIQNRETGQMAGSVSLGGATAPTAAPPQPSFTPRIAAGADLSPADRRNYTPTPDGEGVYVYEVCAAGAPSRRFATQKAAIEYSHRAFRQSVNVQILSPAEALIRRNGHTIGHIRRWANRNRRWARTA